MDKERMNNLIYREGVDQIVFKRNPAAVPG